MRDYASENPVTLLGDIAGTAVQVPASTTTAVVDELFRADPQLHHVIVQGPAGPVLLDRSWFESVITGRLGYGRLLHARKPVLALASPETVVLAYDCTIEGAASAVISGRTAGRAALATVVSWPNGVLKVALISTIFERLARQYAYQSWHDPLTRLPNRGYLREQLSALEARPDAEGPWQAVLFRLDIDRFKSVNDAFGHAAGDEALVQIAARMRAVSRRDDLVVRLGGDEFAVLTAAPLTFDESRSFAARLVEEAAGPVVVEVDDGLGGLTERCVTVSASVGFAHAESAEPGGLTGTFGLILKQADVALRRAKEQGRGRAERFVAGMS
ncbi:diguanylate cyclase [Pengzhenrongella phosphoraccumulans]|uniref:diguanylate cyclase n=1 Tax=Pengzhenrongella phosphoraccumulans TaxID=3114394 RepID=UPI003890C245